MQIEEVNSSAGVLGLRLNNAGSGAFLSGPLYQGYFPDGLYSMASATQAHDLVLMIKSLGFNAVRIHGKVEHPYFYHYADLLGLYIIQVINRSCSALQPQVRNSILCHTSSLPDPMNLLTFMLLRSALCPWASRACGK